MVAGWPVAILRIVFGLMYLDMALQKAPTQYSPRISPNMNGITWRFSL